VGNEVFADLLDAAKRPNKTPPIREEDADKAEQERIKDELVEKAHELIKDKILELTDEELPQLVATILQAMGFKARISPKGPDRGVDVFASPDGLGFQEPRIKVEVKHRPNDQIQAPQLRSFLGGLRAGDKGLYVSSGGFTKEAKYEADRSNVPVMLVDLDELARLIVDHYPRFDSNGQALLPLVRIYWPSE
jgi:restriction system protein